MFRSYLKPFPRRRCRPQPDRRLAGSAAPQWRGSNGRAPAPDRNARARPRCALSLRPQRSGSSHPNRSRWFLWLRDQHRRFGRSGLKTPPAEAGVGGPDDRMNQIHHLSGSDGKRVLCNRECPRIQLTFQGVHWKNRGHQAHLGSRGLHEWIRLWDVALSDFAIARCSDDSIARLVESHLYRRARRDLRSCLLGIQTPVR